MLRGFYFFLFITGILFPALQAQSKALGISDQPCTPQLAQGKNLLLDFGQLCRYEAANFKLLKERQQVDIIYFGDSITEGWGSLLVGFDPSLVLNRGISGQTSSQMLVRFRADVINLRPKIVHILLGANDIAGNTGPTSLKRIKEAIQTLTEQAHAHHIKVILGSLLPAKAYGWASSENPTVFIRAMNSWIQAYAKTLGITYANYYDVLVDDEGAFKAQLSNDGVHPNRAGYIVMNQVAAKALQKASNR